MLPTEILEGLCVWICAPHPEVCLDILEALPCLC